MSKQSQRMPKIEVGASWKSKSLISAYSMQGASPQINVVVGKSFVVLYNNKVIGHARWPFTMFGDWWFDYDGVRYTARTKRKLMRVIRRHIQQKWEVSDD